MEFNAFDIRVFRVFFDCHHEGFGDTSSSMFGSYKDPTYFCDVVSSFSGMALQGCHAKCFVSVECSQYAMLGEHFHDVAVCFVAFFVGGGDEGSRICAHRLQAQMSV